jgi:hypothetical protein
VAERNHVLVVAMTRYPSCVAPPTPAEIPATRLRYDKLQGFGLCTTTGAAIHDAGGPGQFVDCGAGCGTDRMPRLS